MLVPYEKISKRRPDTPRLQQVAFSLAAWLEKEVFAADICLRFAILGLGTI